MTPRLRGHLGLRLGLIALALAAGAAVHFFTRPVFYARALVRLSGSGVERARAVAKELTQPQLVERTAARLGVKATATELERTHLFKIAAEPGPAGEIEVKVWAHSKEWAGRWTEALVAEWAELRRVRRRKETADTIRALNKELAEISEKLGGAAAAETVAADRDGLARRLAEIEALRNPAREIEPLAKRIDALSRIHADLSNPEIPMVDRLAIIAAVEQAAGTGETGSRPAWESIEERRRPLIEWLEMIEFASLAPDAAALALGDEILELDRKLQVEFDTNFRRFDVDYRNLVDRKTALEEKAARPAEPAEAALNLRVGHLRQRIESLGAVAADEGGDPVYAGLRESSGRPVSPDALKIALLSLVAGGGLALGVPLFAGRSGAGRTKLGQLEAGTGLPALGVIPAIENLPSRKPALADLEDERLAPLGEIFGGIRARLLEGGAAPRVLMITSATPGEGKTMTAANLGIAFAGAGVRTLVVDADLRRGRLHRLFGYRRAPGLGDVLAGEIPAEKAIRPTPRENLYVMNAGKMPESGGDPLAAEAFAKTIAQLRESLDLIILDAPPVLGLPATAILARHTDAALLVVSSGQTSPKTAGAAVEVLRGSGAKLRGFVVNRAG